MHSNHPPSLRPPARFVLPKVIPGCPNVVSRCLAADIIDERCKAPGNVGQRPQPLASHAPPPPPLTDPGPSLPALSICISYGVFSFAPPAISRVCAGRAVAATLLIQVAANGEPIHRVTPDSYETVPFGGLGLPHEERLGSGMCMHAYTVVTTLLMTRQISLMEPGILRSVGQQTILPYLRYCCYYIPRPARSLSRCLPFATPIGRTRQISHPAGSLQL
jgi:hypothetical protein